MSRDICLTNREPILRWIDDYIEELRALRRLVSEGGVKGGGGESEKLGEAFMRAREIREGWLRM